MEVKPQVIKSAPLDYVSGVSYNQDTSVMQWSIMDSQVLSWIALIFVIVLLAAYRYGKRRGEALQRVARQKGLSFSARAGGNAEEEFAEFLLFSDNSERKLSNSIRGEMDGVPVSMFDFQATTGVGQSASTRRQSVVIMQSRSPGLPDFEMYPKDMLYKVFRIFSKKAIEFPSRRGFSEAYALKSEDEEAVRKVFSDTVLSYFENHKGLTIEMKGGRLLYYRSGKLAGPDEVPLILQQGIEILRLFE